MSDESKTLGQELRDWLTNKDTRLRFDLADRIDEALAEKDAEIERQIKFNEDGWRDHSVRVHKLVEDRFKLREDLYKANNRIAELESKRKDDQ